MSGVAEKKPGFWGGLLRSGSTAVRKLTKPDKNRPEYHRRASDGDVRNDSTGPRRTDPNLDRERDRDRERERRRHPDRYYDPEPDHRHRRRTESVPPEPRADKGKGRVEQGGRKQHRDGRPDNNYEAAALTEWPPSGMSSREDLSLGRAMELIARGVPAHRGHRRPIPHVDSDLYYRFYVTTTGGEKDDNDGVDLHDSMIQLMTMPILGTASASPANPETDPNVPAHHHPAPDLPWNTIEQPSMTFYYGACPGTITLNQWVTLANPSPPILPLRDTGATKELLRPVDLAVIAARIRYIERHRGLGSDDPNELYKGLYGTFLKDPDKLLNPHRALEKQMADLIVVLADPGGKWIDFNLPKNQVVTRCIYDNGSDLPANSSMSKVKLLQLQEKYTTFYHQLVLSLELHFRICAAHHEPEAQEKLARQLPPAVVTNLALARRWRDNVRVDAFDPATSTLTLRLKLRRRQARMLKRFAQMLKWPNLAATLTELARREAADTLEDVSSHGQAFFSGLILPGPTFPFLIMNTLVDIDPDPATDDLALLTHLHPNCGFQHRSSYTYWTATSIVGKVLAPTCRAALAGWVGPARPTPDLGRSQIARIRTRRPLREGPDREDVEDMLKRSDPLGPPAKTYPVNEYELASPSSDDDVDTVRIELLGLRPCSGGAGGSRRGSEASGSPAPSSGRAASATRPGLPGVFDASVQFAIDGASWPLRLAYDVSFVSAWPCKGAGPHALFIDYAWRRVRADKVVKVRDWGGVHGDPKKKGDKGVGKGGVKGSVDMEVEDDDEVLVIEAFGVPDNEVLARAWCAHWGLSAIVADVGKACMACAIREAYAAKLTVVILVDDGARDDDDNA